jgi:Flp pilus assembly protein CpaB
MRRGRILIFLAIILIIGLILAAVALPRVLPLLRPTPTVAAYQVYHAGQNIAQGTIITEDLITTHPLPETSFAQVMFTVEEKSQLVGQKAKFPIDQGVPITTGMVVSPDVGLEAGGPPWAAIIASGKNAIAIPISRLAAVGYGISDGAHVNIIACMLMVDVDPSYQTILPNHVGVVVSPANVPPSQMPGISLGVNNSLSAVPDPAYQGRTEVESAFEQGIYIIPSESQRPRPVCQMVMQDIPVLKLGNFSLNPESVASNQATPTPQSNQQQQASAQPLPDIVTLVVSPQEAVILAYMVYTNTPMYLTLRNTSDTLRQDTESATLQFLLSQLNIAVPVKLAYAITPRVDVLSLPFLPNDIVTISP